MLIIRASLRELKPQIALVVSMIDREFERVGCETTVLTSGWREHGGKSLHPYGYAADFDSPQMPDDIHDHKWTALEIAVRERLGGEYDVIAHGPRAHLHVEYDPRAAEPETLKA